MSLAKAIKHGKEHRKPYRGSARFDHSCRPGGSCGYCRGNRTIQAQRALQMEPEPREPEPKDQQP
jgi:ferredoxin